MKTTNTPSVEVEQSLPGATHKRRSGITLVETVIALTLLALVLSGSYKIVVLSSSMNRSVRDHYVAVTLARSRIERAKNFAFVDLATLEEDRVVVDYNGTPNTQGHYRRTTVVQQDASSPLVSDVEVTVEIRNSRTGWDNPKKEVITTKLTDYWVPDEEDEEGQI